MGTPRVIGCCLSVGLVLSMLAEALTAAPQTERLTPTEAVSGTWRAEISETQALILRFEKDIIELKVENEGQLSPVQKGKVSFPKEHADRHMDWTDLKAGENSVPDNRCLYRLTGDTLLIIGGGSRGRPSKFYTGPGGEPRTLVFTRVELKPK